MKSFVIEKIERQRITGAPYNPRKITESARKKLKASLKKHGLVMPIVINKRTMNVVGGHQRLDIIDDLQKDKNYIMEYAVIDVDERQETEINVLLNNQSTMGEWDKEKLYDIKMMFEDIDFEKDLGFEKIDLEIMYGELSAFEPPKDEIENDDEEENSEEYREKKILDDMRKNDNWLEAKKKSREHMKEKGVMNNDSFGITDDDYSFTVVFSTTVEKRQFLDNLGIKNTEKYVKGSVINELLHKAGY
jgi:hypothetical protein